MTKNQRNVFSVQLKEALRKAEELISEEKFWLAPGQKGYGRSEPHELLDEYLARAAWLTTILSKS